MRSLAIMPVSKKHAEQDHHERGADLEAAQDDDAVAGARRGEAFCQRLGADRERRDRRHRDGGAEPHDQGRGDAGPEQALRQREHQHDDRAGAGAQADGDDGREAAAPAARSRQFFRLRSVRVAPGQDIVLVVMVVVVAVPMMMRVVIMVVMIAGPQHARGDDGHARAHVARRRPPRPRATRG